MLLVPAKPLAPYEHKRLRGVILEPHRVRCERRAKPDRAATARWKGRGRFRLSTAGHKRKSGIHVGCCVIATAHEHAVFGLSCEGWGPELRCVAVCKAAEACNKEVCGKLPKVQGNARNLRPLPPCPGRRAKRRTATRHPPLHSGPDTQCSRTTATKQQPTFAAESPPKHGHNDTRHGHRNTIKSFLLPGIHTNWLPGSPSVLSHHATLNNTQDTYETHVHQKTGFYHSPVGMVTPYATPPKRGFRVVDHGVCAHMIHRA